MIDILQHAHSGWRYLVLLAVAVAAVRFLVGAVAGSPWRKRDRLLLLVTTIVLDVQLLLGLVLFVMMQAWTVPLYAEHTMIMLIGIALAHAASVWVKRANHDRARFRRAANCLVAAGLLIGLGVYRITAGG
jgi:hypothetical protein